MTGKNDFLTRKLLQEIQDILVGQASNTSHLYLFVLQNCTFETLSKIHLSPLNMIYTKASLLACGFFLQLQAMNV